MKDAIGQTVNDGDLIFVAIGSGRSIGHCFAVVDSAETGRVKTIVKSVKEVFDEPEDPNNNNKYYIGTYPNWTRRKSHYEDLPYEFAKAWDSDGPSKTTLKLKFERAIKILPEQIVDPLMIEFVNREAIYG